MTVATRGHGVPRREGPLTPERGTKKQPQLRRRQPRFSLFTGGLHSAVQAHDQSRIHMQRGPAKLANRARVRRPHWMVFAPQQQEAGSDGHLLDV
ncbi:hypothetical protein IscW_ISCW006010 [Ixodes scapularis]|uniref:Uncharacterized protein n=1 Tax=Ixodes scapularis TaxID=6945 RepID=B7PR00_IXOSC|nr:hypothetical protein IscW_ISCW006010 [Ixodes scapularis]|eukprot:XP_002436192.1 hypothetical protein IscW_ISCW006010 [Ixodes scapularis]